MSLIIIGKFMAGAGTIAAVSVGSIFLHQHLNKDVGLYVYFVAEYSSGDIGTNIASDFECKLEGSNNPSKFKCKVEQLNWKDNKKHLDFSDFDKNLVSPSIAPEKLKVANSVYKLTIDPTSYEVIKNTDKKIEIISSTNGNEKYVTAKLLFSVSENKTVDGKTEYFVVKAPKTIPLTSLTTSDTYQCSWDKNNTVGFEDCEIYDFDSTDPVSGSLSNTSKYESLTFQKTTTKSSSITEHKHYLIKLTESIDPDDNNLDKKQIVFFKKGTDIKTQSVEFSGIQASFLIEDKLLILGAAT